MFQLKYNADDSGGPGAFDCWEIEGLEDAGMVCFSDHQPEEFYLVVTGLPDEQVQGPFRWNEAVEKLYERVKLLVNTGLEVEANGNDNV